MKKEKRPPMPDTRRRLIKEIEAGGRGSSGAATILARGFLGPDGLARWTQYPGVAFPFEIGRLLPSGTFETLGVGTNWKEALDQAENLAKATPYKRNIVSRAIVAAGTLAKRTAERIKHMTIFQERAMARKPLPPAGLGKARRFAEALSSTPRCVDCGQQLSRGRERCFAHQQIHELLQADASFIGAELKETT